MVISLSPHIIVQQLIWSFESFLDIRISFFSAGQKNNRAYINHKFQCWSNKKHQPPVACLLVFLYDDQFTLPNYQLKTYTWITLHKQWDFPLKFSPVNVTKSQSPADLVTFTGEILNGKSHCLCSVIQEILNGKLHFLCNASFVKSTFSKLLSKGS